MILRFSVFIINVYTVDLHFVHHSCILSFCVLTMSNNNIMCYAKLQMTGNRNNWIIMQSRTPGFWREIRVICEVTFGSGIFEKVQNCDRLISIFLHLYNT